MSSIRPAGGWELDPAREPQHPIQQGSGLYRPEPPASPAYSHDPAVVYRYQQSFVNDLRNMGGREARQLTFGAVFGATTGFYLARVCVGLLKVGLVLGGIFLLIVLGRIGGSASSQPTKASASETPQPDKAQNADLQTDASARIEPRATRRAQTVYAAEACPIEKIQMGMTLDDVKRQLADYLLVYQKTTEDHDLYRVNAGECRAVLAFNIDGQLDSIKYDASAQDAPALTAPSVTQVTTHGSSEMACMARELGVTVGAAAGLEQAGRAYYEAEKRLGPGFGPSVGGLDQAAYSRLTRIRAQCMIEQ